jgi:hypothetical protein
MHKNTEYSYHLQLNLNFLLDFIGIYIKHFQTCGLSDVIIINKVIVHKCVKLVITRTVFLNSICMNILSDQWLCLIHLLLNIHHLKHCPFLGTDGTKKNFLCDQDVFSIYEKNYCMSHYHGRFVFSIPQHTVGSSFNIVIVP